MHWALITWIVVTSVFLVGSVLLYFLWPRTDNDENDFSRQLDLMNARTVTYQAGVNKPLPGQLQTIHDALVGVYEGTISVSPSDRPNGSYYAVAEYDVSALNKYHMWSKTETNALYLFYCTRAGGNQNVPVLSTRTHRTVRTVTCAQAAELMVASFINVYDARKYSGHRKTAGQFGLIPAFYDIFAGEPLWNGIAPDDPSPNLIATEVDLHDNMWVALALHHFAQAYPSSRWAASATNLSRLIRDHVELHYGVRDMPYRTRTTGVLGTTQGNRVDETRSMGYRNSLPPRYDRMPGSRVRDTSDDIELDANMMVFAVRDHLGSSDVAGSFNMNEDTFLGYMLHNSTNPNDPCTRLTEVASNVNDEFTIFNTPESLNGGSTITPLYWYSKLISCKPDMGGLCDLEAADRYVGLNWIQPGGTLGMDPTGNFLGTSVTIRTIVAGDIILFDGRLWRVRIGTHAAGSSVNSISVLPDDTNNDVPHRLATTALANNSRLMDPVGSYVMDCHGPLEYKGMLYKYLRIRPPSQDQEDSENRAAREALAYVMGRARVQDSNQKPLGCGSSFVQYANRSIDTLKNLDGSFVSIPAGFAPSNTLAEINGYDGASIPGVCAADSGVTRAKVQTGLSYSSESDGANLCMQAMAIMCLRRSLHRPTFYNADPEYPVSFDSYVASLLKDVDEPIPGKPGCMYPAVFREDAFVPPTATVSGTTNLQLYEPHTLTHLWVLLAMHDVTDPEGDWNPLEAPS